MSTEIANNLTVSLPEVKEKKPRTPSLPAKEFKVLQTIYWFLKSLKSDPSIDLTQEEMDSFRLFDSVERQKEFANSFYDNTKALGQEIRKIQNLKKKNDAKEAKKAAAALAKANGTAPKRSRKSKEPSSTDVSTNDSTDKPKKTKNTKKVTNTQDSLINELVSLARSSSNDDVPPIMESNPPTLESNPPSMESKVKAPKESKAPKEPKVPKESKVKATKEPKVKAPKEPKASKASKESKTLISPSLIESSSNNLLPLQHDNDNLHHDQHDDDDDDDVLEVSPFSLNGQDFLIANDNSLYHPISQTLLGHFHPLHNSFIPI